jgi:hypothetical protein
MLFSPMSEMPQVGCSGIYFWMLFAFVVLQLPTGYAVNMAMLLIFRFFTESFGGPVLATGATTVLRSILDTPDTYRRYLRIPIRPSIRYVSPILVQRLGIYTNI